MTIYRYRAVQVRILVVVVRCQFSRWHHALISSRSDAMPAHLLTVCVVCRSRL